MRPIQGLAIIDGQRVFIIDVGRVNSKIFFSPQSPVYSEKYVLTSSPQNIANCNVCCQRYFRPRQNVVMTLTLK